jgi:A/G-specific adenine glycosylase
MRSPLSARSIPGDARISTLLAWYRKHGRDLPWRRTKDPYAICVSEVMLQQTQVARVIPFFEAWMRIFPDWKALARAKTPALIRAWSGLGYNRRALYLREAARTVCEYGVPKDEVGWRALKGIGPYAAAAIHTFVAQEPAIAIDTNVRRVIGRLMLRKPYPTERDDKAVQCALERVFRRKKDWKALHAIMDLGAMICQARKPQCEQCPLRASCVSRASFLPSSAPRPKIIRKKERTHPGKPFPDRIYRGRILRALQKASRISIRTIGNMIDDSYRDASDREWILRMIDRMQRDGLIEIKNAFIKLPSS